MSQDRVGDAIRFKGIWWRADKPDDRAVGDLIIEPGSVTLELIGNLEVSDPRQVVRYDLIHGAGPKGLATLRGLTQSEFGIHTPGTTRQLLVVGIAVLGAHLRDISVTGAVLSFEHLADWAPPDPPEIARDSDEKGRPNTAIRYAPRPPLEASVDGGAVRLEWTSATSEDRTGDVAIQRTTALTVTLDAASGLDTLLDRFLRPLQNLMTLATGAPNALTGLEVWPAREALIEPTLPEGIERLPGIRVYYPLLVEPGPKKGPVGADRMFFQVADVADDFTGYISRWLAASGDLRAPMDLFFGNQYAPPRFTETRFLVFCQAAEVFHRIRYSNQREEPQAYAAKVRTVVDAISAEHRPWVPWVRSALSQANYKTFRLRIDELVAAAPAAVQAILGDSSAFIEHTAKSRNYYTHWSADQAGVLRGGDLHWLTERLSLLLHAHLMRELGLPVDTIDARFAQNRVAAFVGAQPTRARVPSPAA